MEDESIAKDRTLFGQIRNGQVTKVVRQSNLYIADPDGAGNQDFKVTINAEMS